MTELCKQQAEVIQSHENQNIHNIWQGEALKEKIRGA
jgi:hypothetical protein